MKLNSVRINNFRLLKDIDIDFSTDKSRNLTVVRAENESGKNDDVDSFTVGTFW